MNPTRRIMVAGMKGMILLLALALANCAPAPATRTSTEIPQATKPQVLAAYGKLPLSFEANQGQTDPKAKFLSRGSGYTLFLTSTEAVLTLTKADAHAKPRISDEATLVEPEKRAGTVLRMKLLGANTAPEVAGVGELPGKSNYFVGNDPKKWRANVPTYAKVEYRGIYPGVNLVYYGNQRQVEHDFVVSPGADPKAITLAFEGVDGVTIDALGDLVLRADGSEVRLRKPVVYQEQNGQRAVIPTRYVLKAERQAAFEVAAYDATKPLIIDPVLAYSTYLGRSDLEVGLGIAVDAAGNAYVTGDTQSTNFPTTTGAFQTTFGGRQQFGFGGDAFVTKLNPAGTDLVYSTYLGGGIGDRGHAIAVDATGNAYVTGLTFSTDFPTAGTPTQFGGPFLGRGTDAFVTKLNASGSVLLYSRYLGGFGSDSGHGIAVDAAGNAYVTGDTQSTNFPTLGAFQGALSGSIFGQDAFVTKLDAAGALLYSTYLGGTGSEVGVGIGVDSTGNAYVTGSTGSIDFPTTSGAFQPTSGGFRDAFVTKLNTLASGSASLVYSTYLGGSGDDTGRGIAVDAAGNAYVAGETDSVNFPTTAGAFQTIFGGIGVEAGDAFVAKLNATGAALVYSTFLGGSSGDQGFAIAVDAAGSAYVTGLTRSTNFPTTPDAFQIALAGINFNAFVTKLNTLASGSASLVYSTYHGGSVADVGLGIAVDKDGSVYVTGQTLSFDFPTTTGAFQTASGGGFDAFVAKLSSATTNTPVGDNIAVSLPPVTLTFANVTQAGTTTVSTSSSGPPPPSGFRPGSPPTYFDITTTADFSRSVQVCINYTAITFSAFSNTAGLMRLMHFLGTGFVDVTTSLNTTAAVICGLVNSFSPFAIFEPAILQFAAFQSKVEIEDERHKREFKVKGTFKLGSGSDGIHPLTEDVILQVGAFAATIPKGSFRRHGHGTFKFEGTAGGARLEMKIQARGAKRFEFKAEGKGVQVGTANPVTVRLAIGDDAGSTLASVKADDD